MGHLAELNPEDRTQGKTGWSMCQTTVEEEQGVTVLHSLTWIRVKLFSYTFLSCGGYSVIIYPSFHNLFDSGKESPTE